MNDQNNSQKEVKDYGKRVDQLVVEFEKQIHEHLNEEYIKSTKWSDKLADKIAAFGGSWNFIIIFFAILLVWIVVNTLSFTKIIHFDEPPFILLNLVLSFLAGFQAPIIMMSQNRQAARDKKETIIDFAINYRAEQEIDDMQEHLHRIEANFAEFRSEVRNELAAIKELLQENKKPFSGGE
ncbi:DUF1003 domain-containing protein [Brevibacillus fluminis]|uniref:DUF1003 domain-containing protein n=1 Tax=Brevibacillus fluminis TaxID=511487 RepID=A0A3M8DZ18_9BACL|nr:DUF1003 domain-containing protein [Brevibacillus fluminis]RNB92481.1 DUF1003 domain-containing protein [Brevibacillus fluminis]